MRRALQAVAESLLSLAWSIQRKIVAGDRGGGHVGTSRKVYELKLMGSLHRFENPFKAGETVMLRPEDSMRIQHSIGADIIMWDVSPYPSKLAKGCSQATR